MAWLGQGTPALLQGFRPGSDPRLPAYMDQPSEGLEIARTNAAARSKDLAAQLGFQGQQAGLDRGQRSAELNARQAFEGGQNEANRAQERGLLTQNLDFQGNQAGLQREFQGGQAAADRANQLSIAQMPWDYKNKVFGTVSPLLQGLLGPGGSGSFQQGGEVPAPPGASNAQVWTDQQVQQKVNDQKAQSAQAAGTQVRANQTRTAAGGFGSNSPLLAALNSQTNMQRMQADADAELGTRLDAAKANAAYGIDRDKVNAQNYATQVGGLTNQRRANLDYQSSLLAALAGMI